METAWTTNDLATTRPRTGVVSYRTGRAGALPYLKHTLAPPELPPEREDPRGGDSEAANITWYCQRDVAVLYTRDGRTYPEPGLHRTGGGFRRDSLNSDLAKRLQDLGEGDLTA